MGTIEQTRQELLSTLTRLSQLRPEWRLGQMLANLAITAGGMDPGWRMGLGKCGSIDGSKDTDRTNDCS